MTFTCIIVTLKHRKRYLQVSVTLSKPIHWFCLCSPSKLCSPMSLNPWSRTFWFWPDMWRYQWTLGQISHHAWKVHVHTGLANGGWILEIGPIVWEITGGSIRPPHQQNVWLARAQRVKTFSGDRSRDLFWWPDVTRQKRSVSLCANVSTKLESFSSTYSSRLLVMAQKNLRGETSPARNRYR